MNMFFLYLRLGVVWRSQSPRYGTCTYLNALARRSFFSSLLLYHLSACNTYVSVCVCWWKNQANIQRIKVYSYNYAFYVHIYATDAMVVFVVRIIQHRVYVPVFLSLAVRRRGRWSFKIPSCAIILVYVFNISFKYSHKNVWRTILLCVWVFSVPPRKGMGGIRFK